MVASRSLPDSEGGNTEHSQIGGDRVRVCRFDMAKIAVDNFAETESNQRLRPGVQKIGGDGVQSPGWKLVALVAGEVAKDMHLGDRMGLICGGTLLWVRAGTGMFLRTGKTPS